MKIFQDDFKKDYLDFTAVDSIKMLLVIGAASLIGMLFDRFGFSEATIINIYVLGVLVTSVWTNGKVYGAIGSLVSVFAFNFFFTEPKFTLLAYDPDYPVTFVVMMLVSVITGSLALRIKNQAIQAAEKAYRTSVLLEHSQQLQTAMGIEEIEETTSRQLYKLLNREVKIYSETRGQYTGTKDEKYVDWVFRNEKHAGWGTNVFPEARSLYLPIRGQKKTHAVAVIAMGGEGGLEDFEKNLMQAMLDECGIVLEKELLSQEKQKMEMMARQEALRSNLLRSISHDLRTPLTSISGNAAILLENGEKLDIQKKNSIYMTIYDDSMWLANLVENLLSITRIENGNMKIKREPELLEDVFAEALSHLDRRADKHQIILEPSEEFLMVNIDARLIVQVIINIVNNAIAYTQEGSRIVVRSGIQNDGMVYVEIADDGPGVDDEVKEHIFEMFYTANNSRGDGRRSTGLGLALCKGIIHAHEGQIEVYDNHPKGAVFRFTLEQAEVKPYV